MSAPRAEGESRALAARCRAEVLELHCFFVDWFTGALPDADGAFARLSDVLAEGFRLIPPSGKRVDRVALLARLRSAHGTHRGRAFGIRIENVEVRHLEGPLCLITYEEWQQLEGKAQARLSSAWFRERPGTPHGVAWLHLHETALL